MSFDSYHKWLGIPPEQQPPHYYQLLGISVNEQDAEVIQTAAQRQRASVEDHLHGKHHREATQLIFELDEAELTLSSPELREDYNKRVKLVLKRQKSKQSGRNLDPDSNRPAGEGSGLMHRFLGIMSVILAGFLIMAYFSYQLPRTEEEKKELRAQPISVEKKQPAPVPPVVSEKKENPEPAPASLAKTQAEAVAWIFSVGGKVTLQGGKVIEAAADLPPSPFEIFAINLVKCDITDATLANILPLTSVQTLLLTETRIADNSIAVINQLQNLQSLFLPGTGLSGQEIAQLSAQLQLRTLHINNNMDFPRNSGRGVKVRWPVQTVRGFYSPGPNVFACDYKTFRCRQRRSNAPSDGLCTAPDRPVPFSALRRRIPWGHCPSSSPSGSCCI